jgi:hypothetical protein
VLEYYRYTAARSRQERAGRPPPGGARLVEEAGYVAVTPGRPDDPETVEEAHAHPEVFARKTIGQVADHYSEVISKLARKPAVPLTYDQFRYGLANAVTEEEAKQLFDTFAVAAPG